MTVLVVVARAMAMAKVAVVLVVVGFIMNVMYTLFIHLTHQDEDMYMYIGRTVRTCTHVNHRHTVTH